MGYPITYLQKIAILSCFIHSGMLFHIQFLSSTKQKLNLFHTNKIICCQHLQKTRKFPIYQVSFASSPTYLSSTWRWIYPPLCIEKTLIVLNPARAAGYLSLAVFAKCSRKRGTWLIAHGNKIILPIPQIHSSAFAICGLQQSPTLHYLRLYLPIICSIPALSQ